MMTSSKMEASWNLIPSLSSTAIPGDPYDHHGCMTITVAHITPLVALIAGILILLVPRLLNYVVAIYLIIVGITGLNGIYHFIR